MERLEELEGVVAALATAVVVLVTTHPQRDELRARAPDVAEVLFASLLDQPMSDQSIAFAKEVLQSVLLLAPRHRE